MELKEKFENASDEVKKLASRPDSESLLALYAYYKQATVGDVQGKRPGMLDITGRKKYDAWADKQGLNETSAMNEYIALVQKLQAAG